MEKRRIIRFIYLVEIVSNGATHDDTCSTTSMRAGSVRWAKSHIRSAYNEHSSGSPLAQALACGLSSLLYRQYNTDQDSIELTTI
jgi:hypothetical protein